MVLVYTLVSCSGMCFFHYNGLDLLKFYANKAQATNNKAFLSFLAHLPPFISENESPMIYG